MAKFVCVTQFQNLASYKAVTGINYQSIRGLPFVVHDLDDIKFFENKKQFQKVGIFNKPKMQTEVDNTQLDAYLQCVEGLSKTSIKKILEAYNTLEQVRDDILTEKNRFNIPKKQLEYLKKNLFPEDVEEDDE